LDEIKKASDALSQTIQKVGTELYKTQQEAQKEEDKTPDIDEGEIEEDKDKDKK